MRAQDQILERVALLHVPDCEVTLFFGYASEVCVARAIEERDVTLEDGRQVRRLILDEGENLN